jgi:hypothetical protein
MSAFYIRFGVLRKIFEFGFKIQLVLCGMYMVHSMVLVLKKTNNVDYKIVN